MSQRLQGRVVLVTRPREQAAELSAQLRAEGADVLSQPAIEILPPETWDGVDGAIKECELKNVNWVVFSSANGARAVVERLRALYPNDDGSTFDLFAARGVRVAAVGASTADVLRSLGIDVELVPRQFDAEGLVDAFVERLGRLDGLNVCSFRASRGRKVLSERLGALGAKVVEVEAYRSVDTTTPDPNVLDALRDGKIDYAFVSSSASARALVNMFGSDARKTRWIALSPLTASALAEQGVDACAVAKETTSQGLLDALLEFVARN